MAKHFISEKSIKLELDGIIVAVKKGDKIEFSTDKILIKGVEFKTDIELNMEIEILLSNSKSETLEIIYQRYEYLASYYASKLWNNDDSAIEKDDLVQELKIRLFTSIQSYLDKWRLFREKGGIKPIPIEFYLKTVMINKSRDLIKELNSNAHTSIDEMGLQFGSTAVEIHSVDKINIFLGSQNLIEMFEGRQKTFMQLYFANDFDLDKVLMHFKGEGRKWLADKVISQGIEKLKNFLKNDIECSQEFYYYEIQE